MDQAVSSGSVEHEAEVEGGSGKTNRAFWLLPVSVAIAPFSAYVAGLCFAAFVGWEALRLDWRRRFRERVVVVVGLAILVSILWFALTTTSALGLGFHSLRKPWRSPVTVLDYVPYLVAFLVLSLRRWTAWERRALLTTIVITIPLVLFVGAGERYLGWNMNVVVAVFAPALRARSSRPPSPVGHQALL